MAQMTFFGPEFWRSGFGPAIVVGAILIIIFLLNCGCDSLMDSIASVVESPIILVSSLGSVLQSIGDIFSGIGNGLEDLLGNVGLGLQDLLQNLGAGIGDALVSLVSGEVIGTLFCSLIHGGDFCTCLGGC